VLCETATADTGPQLLPRHTVNPGGLGNRVQYFRHGSLAGSSRWQQAAAKVQNKAIASA